MRGVLLTGLPGVGKSTACRKVVNLLEAHSVRVEGFLTEEIRERGARVGFDVVGLGTSLGKRVPLARTGDGKPRVGRYAVTLQDFESLALPILDTIFSINPDERVVCILDEIGKMELFSHAFVNKMRELLKSRPAPILCTIALHGGGFIAETKRLDGLELIEIDTTSRDAVPEDIVARLTASWSEPAARGQKERQSAQGKTSARRWKPRTATTGDVKGAEDKMDLPGQGCRQVVLWARNVLRLADNPLLLHCCEVARSCSASLTIVACLDPRDFDHRVRTMFGSPKIGEHRRRFLDEALADLELALASLGSRLVVCEASPESVLPLLVEKGGLVVAAGEACPEEVAAETRVRAALMRVGADLDLHRGSGISTLFGPAELSALGLRAGAEFPEDFHDFYDVARRELFGICRRGLHAVPSKLPPVGTIPETLPGLRQPSTRSCSLYGPSHETALVRGGESEALARLRHWIASGGVGRYKTTFRHLLGDYSSRLSASLALGCLSPCRFGAEAMVAVRSGPHVTHLLYELCWRDFFRQVAARWGPLLFVRDGPLGVGRPWRRDPVAEERWKQGKTGVPLVDAAMRELLTTGYLGNLARQFTAAYLVEEGIDWRVGADWFEATLTDYDPHSNWGQWARSAGVAPTNEAKRHRVGGTRYLDIAVGLAGEAELYIRTWVAELAEVSEDEIFAPWRSARPHGYPAPACSDRLRRYFEAAGQWNEKDGFKGRGRGRTGK